jgi:chromate reductase, NAD(P)H dehydrogenase (quinone)
MTRILLIPGSTRDQSLQTAALRTADRFAPHGVTTHLYGGLRTLSAFVPGEAPPPEDVAQLRQWVLTSEAILFCTPQYAGDIPGSLKNLLDWLVDGGDLHGKPVAWLSVSGPGEDEEARATLEKVLGHGLARLLRPACVRIPLVAGSTDDQGLVIDGTLHQALHDMLEALVRSLDVREQEQQQPSWAAAQSSVYPMVPQAAGPPRSTPPFPYRTPSRSTVRRQGPTHFPAHQYGGS